MAKKNKQIENATKVGVAAAKVWTPQRAGRRWSAFNKVEKKIDVRITFSTRRECALDCADRNAAWMGGIKTHRCHPSDGCIGGV